MDVAEELVDVGKLEDLLEGDDEDQLEFVVQLVLERQVLVVERVRTGAFLMIYGKEMLPQLISIQYSIL